MKAFWVPVSELYFLAAIMCFNDDKERNKPLREVAFFAVKLTLHKISKHQS